MVFAARYIERPRQLRGEVPWVRRNSLLKYPGSDIPTRRAISPTGICVPASKLRASATVHDGLAARRMMRSPHVAGNLGDSIPTLLRTAGFDCAEVAAQRRIIGRVTFYRATRPA